MDGVGCRGGGAQPSAGQGLMRRAARSPSSHRGPLRAGGRPAAPVRPCAVTVSDADRCRGGSCTLALAGERERATMPRERSLGQPQVDQLDARVAASWPARRRRARRSAPGRTRRSRASLRHQRSRLRGLSTQSVRIGRRPLAKRSAVDTRADGLLASSATKSRSVAAASRKVTRTCPSSPTRSPAPRTSAREASSSATRPASHTYGPMPRAHASRPAPRPAAPAPAPPLAPAPRALRAALDRPQRTRQRRRTHAQHRRQGVRRLGTIA